MYEVDALNIKIGLEIPQKEVVQGIRYEVTAPAIDIAIERAKAEGLVSDINFTVIHAGSYRRDRDDTLESLKLLTEEKVNVLFGPTFTGGAKLIGSFMAYYNIPQFLFGPSPLQEFDDKESNPLTATVVPNVYKILLGLIDICREFEWTDIAFVYTTSPADVNCRHIAPAIEGAIADASYRVVLSYKARLILSSSTATSARLNELKEQARIVFTCFENAEDTRRFMSAIVENGMANDEYVYITTVDHDYVGGEWDDGLDNSISKAEKYFLFFTRVINADNSKLQQFEFETLQRAKRPPYNCADCAPPTIFAYYLHDATYFYLNLLEEVLQTDPNSYQNGEKVMKCKHMQLKGMSGDFTVHENCIRDASFSITAFNSSLKLETFMNIHLRANGSTLEKTYDDESKLWGARGGIRPHNHLKSGKADGSLAWISGPVLGGACIICVFFTCFYLHRLHRQAELEIRKLWQIDYFSLIPPETVKHNQQSQVSLQSDSEMSVASSKMIDTDPSSAGYEVYIFNGEAVLAKSHRPLKKFTKKHYELMKNMKQVVHENLNPFVGFCINAPNGTLSVWKRHFRCSLKDVLIAKPPTSDAFFKFSLMKDLINGLDAIHTTPFLKYHGSLSSKCCLVNESLFLEDLLWTAPELLRTNSDGSKEGDIYSFAIICSEIATEQTAWNDIRDDDSAEEIVYNVKRGRPPYARPKLEVNTEDFSPMILQLIRDCWSEHPDDRPTTKIIRKYFFDAKLSNKKSLMDHMLRLSEDYAEVLKQEVEEKTKEAIAEQERADILLYRILPKQVAKSLKMGQIVEPELFDEASIFYSDIVSFTVLAAKCSPMQVVALLNDLYTMFDSTIDEHDVYKVETVGDAYLCASGVPNRNGHEHGREIANMALLVVKHLKNFKVPHLPNETVNVRIGMHTGSVVAGVVGLTMPRYCLVGESVSMATRMESHGKPGRIQLSPEANHLLTEVIGGFKTKSRGEVLIKGTGVMETFWLLGCKDKPELDITIE
uniref:guanylate cyclase n=1 Tax=Syphacia muris TaxID=451379 RepID=A0A0N5AKU2_9BILA